MAGRDGDRDAVVTGIDAGAGMPAFTTAGFRLLHPGHRIGRRAPS
ncbi:hypothetical protein ABZ912_41830 [Nonomuraea angiospora]